MRPMSCGDDRSRARTTRNKCHHSDDREPVTQPTCSVRQDEPAAAASANPSDPPRRHGQPQLPPAIGVLVEPEVHAGRDKNDRRESDKDEERRDDGRRATLDGRLKRHDDGAG